MFKMIPKVPTSFSKKSRKNSWNFVYIKLSNQFAEKKIQNYNFTQIGDFTITLIGIPGIISNLLGLSSREVGIDLDLLPKVFNLSFQALLRDCFWSIVLTSLELTSTSVFCNLLGLNVPFARLEKSVIRFSGSCSKQENNYSSEEIF